MLVSHAQLFVVYIVKEVISFQGEPQEWYNFLKYCASINEHGA